MARKNLLEGLMEAPAPNAAPARANPKAQPRLETKAMRPRSAKGAIGAVGQQIADLKSRAVIELDPGLIRGGGLEDRLSDDDADDVRLRASIQTYGQQVPVLVRPHPDEDGAYQIVYGRRRVLATRDLGLKVKALVRDLDDQALVLAQGQENTARRDLSFIEKAHFARQLRDGGYDRKVIADAINADATEISRFLSVADRIPAGVLRAIGSAPGIGRARWMKLADAMEADGTMEREACNLCPGNTSEEKFEALLKAVTIVERRAKEARAKTRKRQSESRPRVLTGVQGQTVGQVRTQGAKTVITLGGRDGFAEWLVENMQDLHKRWRGGG
ncbi:MAG: plasmid partitioning protein RepB [Pseudomonadota bacterium]